MQIWQTIRRGADRVRNIVGPGHGGAMEDIEGVRSAAALIRAIDVSMPRGATLWIEYPEDEAVALFLAERTGAVHGEPRKSFRLPIRADNLPMLARLVEGSPPRVLGIHLGVDHEHRRLLTAYDLDAGRVVVALSSRLPAEARRNFMLAATGVPPGER